MQWRSTSISRVKASPSPSSSRSPGERAASGPASFVESRKTMRQTLSRRRPKFNSVEEYLASLDPTKERTLRSVIDLILTQFQELESKISWNVPTIHRNGK